MRNVQFLRGYNSRNYSTVTGQDKGEKNLSFSLTLRDLLGWCRADKSSLNSSFPLSRHRELLEDTWCSALCLFFAPERPQRRMTRKEV